MPDVISRQRGDYALSTDPARLDFEVIYGFIRESYWGEGITRPLMQRQIEHSTFNFGLYHTDGQQVGFAQVLTNFTTFAYLGNVFVLPEHRGQGLSKWLVETICQLPDLQSVRRFLLATRDAHGLYAQFGFTPLAQPETFMERYNPAWPKQNAPLP